MIKMNNLYQNCSRIIVISFLASPLAVFYSIQFNSNKSNFDELLSALAWGLILFEALFAFGLLANSIFIKRIQIANIAPSFGLALVLIIFGWLNLFGFVYQQFITFIMTSGALYLVVYAWLSRRNISFSIKDERFPTLAVSFLVTLAILCIIWGYFWAVANTEFNIHDDYHAYLFFPKKALDLGLLNLEPFSERRLISGLAGNSILLAIGLANVKWYFLHLIDWGLGILVVSYLILTFKMNADRISSVFLKFSLVVGICFFSNPAVNISSNMLPMALIFSIWVWIFFISESQSKISSVSFLDGAYIGIMMGALLSLKSTLIPYIAISFAMICVYSFVFGLIQRNQFLKFILGVFVAMMTGVVAWSLDLFRSSGTFLYPLLGKGLHATQYGYFDVATTHFFKKGSYFDDLQVLISPLGKSIFLLSFFLLLMYLIEIQLDKKKARLLTLASLPLFASVMNCLIVGYALGGYGAYRYIYFVSLISLVVSILIAFQCPNSRLIRAGAYLVCVFFLIRGAQDQFLRFAMPDQKVQNRVDMLNPLSDDIESNYAELSKFIPHDGGVLLRVSYPFLLAARSNVFIADYPGSASPPPGMPIGKGPNALRNYLLSCGIWYVAWDYQKEANFAQNTYHDRLQPNTHPWISSEARLTFDFQENLELLRVSSKIIFDKNGIAIIDLR